MRNDEIVNVRYMVDDVTKALDFYTTHFGFKPGIVSPAFADVMKDNLEEMNALGVKVPVLVGGAALTRDYAEDDLANLYRGSLLYCKDAFEGLHAMDSIANGQLESAIQTQRERAEKRLAKLEAIVRAARPRAKIEVATSLGPVLGTHAGPGTVGLFWFDDPVL